MKLSEVPVVIIRKYKNNKYYNMESKKYVSQSTIFELFLIRKVSIICAVTLEDITNTEIPKMSKGMVVDVHNIKELFKR